MWGTFSRPVKGLLVKGDENIPATRWWNHLYLLFFGWRTVAVLEASLPFGFLVGYRDFRGKCMLCDQTIKGGCVRVKVGREDCTFFAINVFDGGEVSLKEVVRTTKNDPAYANVPLL